MLGAALARFPRVPVSMHGISTNRHLVSILRRVIGLTIVICCMLASRPKPLPPNGKPPSRSTLRQRIRTHYFGNAEGSTLRRTLGCLLSSNLGIALRRVGSGSRYTFTNPGEQVLDRWMAQHAFVCWVETNAPWEIETRLLASGLSLPLNVDGNPCREAVTAVRTVRLRARQLADQLEIIADSGGPRKPPVHAKP